MRDQLILTKKSGIALDLGSRSVKSGKKDHSTMKETESEKREPDEFERYILSLVESDNQQETGTARQEHCDKLDESGTIRARRARLGATSAATTVVAASSVAENSTELGVKGRPKTWWDQCNSRDFSENEFRAAFHMGRATFNMICDELRSFVAKKNDMLLAKIPMEQGVAVCIWRLATGDPLQCLSDKFGLHMATCSKLVKEVCSAIKTVLKPKFLMWPRDEDYISSMKSKFEFIAGIQNVIGSMYTTHVPITAPPKTSRAEYLNVWHTKRNEKSTYTVTLQGVVDPHGVFTDISIGQPGSMSDEQVLKKSELYWEAAAGMMTDTWVVGGKSYPLMDWLLVPYHHQDLTWLQHAFNEKIADLRSVSVGAFTRLKSRWGCLQKRIDMRFEDVPAVLEACCVLHNICEMEREEMGPEIILYELIDGETVPKEPVRSLAAKEQRDNIMDNLLHWDYATSAATTVVSMASGAESSAEIGADGQPKSWWDQCNSRDFPEKEFRAAFRMGRATFNKICDELRSVVVKDNTMLLATIPVEQGVAFCIWRLVTGDPFPLMLEKFGLSNSNYRRLVVEVCSAIKTVLKPKFLKWPRDADYISSMKSKFEFTSGIQNVIGSMYTTHVPIFGSAKINPDEYSNRWYTKRNDKITYTIALQGVVDPYGAFIDVSIGQPGSMSDEQVLEKSVLYREAEACMMTDTWVVGGTGYPLMDWVLVPYHLQKLTEPQQVFNEKIDHLRSVSKGAFTRLKSRWGCLQKRTEMRFEDVPVMVEACCVLHNICEMEHEEMGPEIIQYELIDGETVPMKPVRSLTALQQRDNIATILFQEYMQERGFLL